jgi:hypothetical protein
MSICNAETYYRIKNPDIQNCRITYPAGRKMDKPDIHVIANGDDVPSNSRK